MNLIYHGKDVKQCFYEPQCLICFVRCVAVMVRLRISTFEAKQLKDGEK